MDALPPPTVAAPGAALPDVPEWSTNFSADYERALWGVYKGFVGAAWRYADVRDAEFPVYGGPRQRMPSYNLINLKAGMETDRWSATLYVKNVGNTMVLTSVNALTFAGGLGTQYGPTLAPRTVGIELSAKF
jgi:outer membrane receptor protein involved in Fe transport